jgi:DNA-binding PadR family transcriptional regulator
MTASTARVLAALLDDPKSPHYGLDVMHRAELASGSLYPILRRLETAGWVTSSWEPTAASELGRPRRRYYALTPNGTERARQVLAELSALSRPRTASRRRSLRPGIAGGAR